MHEPRPPDHTSDDRTKCFFCGAAPAGWRRQVDDDRLVDRDGNGFSLGQPLFLCDGCEAAFAGRRDDEMLLAVGRRLRTEMSPDGLEPVTDVDIAGWADQEVGGILPALLRAAGQPRRLEHFVETPEIVTLLTSGWIDLDGVTGAVGELAALWPAVHHHVLADERPNRGEDGDRHLVRSPWPALSVDDVLDVLWRWVERDQEGLVASARRHRILEVFGWTQDAASTLLRGPDPRDRRSG